MQTGTGIAPAVISVPIGLVHCCAASLARDGQREAAERLLLAIPAEAVTAPVLDLLARIYAQRGKYAEAEGQWTQAVQLDPNNEKYQRCLRAAERRRSDKIWLRNRWVVAVAALMFVFGVITIAIRYLPRSGRGVRMSGAKVEALSPSQPAVVEGNSPRTDASIEIRFPRALFSHGTSFTGPGKRELREFAMRLRSFRPEARVEIQGHTDAQALKPSETFRSNEELAIARALAVAIFLHRQAGLPLTRVSLSAAPAHGGKSSVRDLSQRTVAIRIVAGPN